MAFNRTSRYRHSVMLIAALWLLMQQWSETDAQNADIWIPKSVLQPFLNFVKQSNKKPPGFDFMKKIINKSMHLIVNGTTTQHARILKSMSLTLPPEVNRLRLMWRSGTTPTYYSIRMKSYDRKLLQNPKFSLNKRGKLPLCQTEVQIILQCTGRATGPANFSVNLSLMNARNITLPRSTLDYTITKLCSSNADRKAKAKKEKNKKKRKSMG